ncbi:transposase [Luteolibacter algae]|uniref:Transposase n=1 Tax=Luteolibacter algae TaxID=454151 RepID=A0ABW5D6W9_9BACT
MKFQGEKYLHESWVIMPNHLHILTKPLEPLEKLIHAWKSTFSHNFDRGRIWQKGYRDTLIRDPKHFANCVRYIRRNPRQLPRNSFTLWESDRAKKVSAYKV